MRNVYRALLVNKQDRTKEQMSLRNTGPNARTTHINNNGINNSNPYLVQILRHGVEDVEKCLELEVLEMHRLQGRRTEVVAPGETELGLWCRGLFRPRARERRV